MTWGALRHTPHLRTLEGSAPLEALCLKSLFLWSLRGCPEPALRHLSGLWHSAHSSSLFLGAGYSGRRNAVLLILGLHLKHSHLSSSPTPCIHGPHNAPPCYTWWPSFLKTWTLNEHTQGSLKLGCCEAGLAPQPLSPSPRSTAVSSTSGWAGTLTCSVTSSPY